MPSLQESNLPARSRLRCAGVFLRMVEDRKLSSMIRSLVFLFLPAIALAQSSDTALKIPLLGYAVSDSPLRVRPIAGAPGAVTLGDPVPLPAGVTRVVVAPGRQFAIVEATGAVSSALLALTLDGSGTIAPIANSFSHSDRIAFSPSGSFAVLYSAAAQQAQVIAGSPSSPQLSRTVDLTAPSLPLTSIAVSDDGQAILAGVSDGSHGSVWSFIAGQPAQQIAAAGLPSALRFLAAGRDAVMADRAWQQIVRLPSGAPAQILAGSGQGIRGPSDLEISSDRHTVWVADVSAGESALLKIRRTAHAPQSGKLLGIDLTSGAITTVESSFAAASVTRLAGDSVFLLTSAGGDAAGIWAPSASNATVWQLTGASIE